MFNQALSIAQQEKDMALEIRALANLADVQFHHLRWPEVSENGLRAIELARRVDEPEAENAARLYTTRALLYSGESGEAHKHELDLLDQAERLRHSLWLGTSLWSVSHLYLFEGNWKAARDLIDRCLSILPGDPRFICTRTLLEHLAGDLNQGGFYLRRLLKSTRDSAMGAAAA